MANNLTEFGRKTQALNNNSTCRWVQLHTADPGTDGQANKYGGAESVIYDSDETKLRNGLSDSTIVPEFSVAAGVTITHVTLRTTSSSPEATVVFTLPVPQTPIAPATIRISDLTITVA